MNSGFAQTDGGPHDASTPITLSDSGGSPHDGNALKQTDVGTTMSGPAIVYGQSSGTLYAVDPDTNAVTTVGTFSGCDDEVIDIALDKNSVMYATTPDSVYTVNTTTAHCTLLAGGGSYPNSLSFVPAGTLDPTAEALVGYVGGTYVRIDTTTGAVSKVGTLGKGYSSSGDIVSVIGGGTYLTVTGGEACSESDCLVGVDPSTGAMLTNYGPLGYSAVYGLAFWAGTVYGFDAQGALFQVTFNGNTIAVTAIPIPNAPSNLSFYGAGSTTSAPPVPMSK